MSWRTPITLGILLAVLLGAAYYGWQTIASPAENESPTAKKSPGCKKTVEFRKGQKIKSSDITVNVYNAGSIVGLADNTLHDLHDQGFVRGTAENAPEEVTARNVTILTDSKKSPQVELVASQFRGRVRIASGPALADGIDIIVGDSFKGVASSAKKSLRVKQNVETCASGR